MSKKLDLRLYAIFDPEICLSPADLSVANAVTRIGQALDGGITALQLRDKRAGSYVRLQLAAAVKKRLDGANVPLIINDHVELAVEVGADGVHVGRADTSPQAARDLIGPERLLGVTIHRIEEADDVAPKLADYAGVGPVYITHSKDPGDPPLGPFGFERLLRQIRRVHPDLPCVAIAGINHKNALPILAAGADGLAVIGDVFLADNIEKAASRLRRILDQGQTVVAQS